MDFRIGKLSGIRIILLFAIFGRFSGLKGIAKSDFEVFRSALKLVVV